MDARKKKVLIVLGMGSVILVWRVYVVAMKHFPSSAQAGAPSAVEPTNADLEASVAAQADERTAKSILKAQEEAARQPWGRDPFAAVVADAPKLPESEPAQKEPVAEPPPTLRLTFTGVSKVDDEWKAIVSGRFIGVGDVVESDYRVSLITKRSITLQSKGWTLRYELGKETPLVERLSETP